MKMNEKNPKNPICLCSKFVFLLFVILIIAIRGWSQNHDLVMDPAPNITSSSSTDWKSPDIKIGADFGDTSVANIVRRGVPNSVYARFRINGIQDYTIPSGDIEIKFYYRGASIGDTPPALSDATWTPLVDTLSVTYTTSDGPFAITREWPTDFPSVTTKAVSWTPPVSGTYFHVAAEVVYPSGIVDENPGDNVAISLYESQSGLLDIVLLHDTSGSMGYYTYDGFNYMDHAKSRAAAFIFSMNEAHRFAVVAFSSDYVGGSEDIWPTPTASLQLANATNKSSAVTAIMGLTDGGMTPMGAGLDRAIQILTTPMTPDRKRVILLLSDGYENWGTPRACAGIDPVHPCVGGTILSQLQANNIRVFSIALGTAAWTECLECLALQSNGEWYSTPGPGIDLTEVYLHMQQAYTGDDLYRLDRGITGGGDDVYSTYFEGLDNVLYFILSWDDLEAQLGLQLRPPDRSWTEPEGLSNALVHKGKGYVVVRVENPARGTWEYKVTGDEEENYLVAVRSDRVGVRLEMDLKSKGIVGGPIAIQAHLAHGKEPVKDARLTATIQMPVDSSFETKLRQAARNHMLRYKTIPVDLGELKEFPDASPHAVFIRKMTDQRPELLIKTRSMDIQLEHKGNGFYSGLLKGDFTTTAGQYTVTVKCGEKKFHRTFSKQLRLYPGKVNHEKSFAEILRVKSITRDPIWLLRIYPVDQFDNAITTPLLVERVKAVVKDTRMFKKTEIAFGAFQQELSVLPGQKPLLIRVTIDGNRVKVKKVDCE